MNSPTQTEEAIYIIALRFPKGERRRDFLRSACGDDHVLLARLEARLRSDDFMQLPAHPIEPKGAPIRTINSLDESPGARIGRYRLLERIGEGGCGRVFMADQEEPVRRRVALKIIKLGMDTREVVARFEAERQALALMDHLNIARVLDAGATETGRPYFVMELVKGLPLLRFCDQQKLGVRERLELFISVCQAIQHAHQKGIIHRDIKPSNILVSLHDGVPVAKVIDFGIAKAISQRLTDLTLFTQMQQVIGTPAYMSPEQLEQGGLDVDTRTDIFSLGVVLYELVTGRTPFDTKKLLESGLDALRQTLRDSEPARPSHRLSTHSAGDLSSLAKTRNTEPLKLRTLVRGDLDWIVMKCLEKDRTRRYETANGLAMDLRRFLSNEAIVARPPSTAYRFRKFVARNRVAFLTGSAVAAAVVAGLAAIVLVQRQSNEQLTATNIELNSARRRISEQLDSSRRIRAELTFKKGREMAEHGDVAIGLFWMLESLRVAPEEMTSFRELVRLGIHSWSQVLPRFVHAWPGGGRALCFASTPEGGTMVVGFQNGELRCLETATGRELKPVARFPDRMVASLEFSPDGRFLAIGLAGDRDRSGAEASKVSAFDTPCDALLWDVDKWERTGPPMPHGGGVYNVRFSKDGARLLTREYPGTTLRLWKTGTTELLREPLLVDKHQIAEDVEFSPDGRLILLRMQQAGRSRVLDAATLEPAGIPLPIDGWAHQFRPDGRTLLTSRPDRVGGSEMRLLDVRTGGARDFQLDLPTSTYSSTFLPNGRGLLVMGEDATVRGWDMFAGRPLWDPMPEDDVGWTGVTRDARYALTPLGQWQLPRPLSRPAAVVDRITSGRSEIRFGRSSDTAVEFGAQGRLVLTRADGPQSGTVAARLRDTRNGQPVGIPLRTPGNTLSDVALSPDGTLAATCAIADPGLWEFNVGFVELWDTMTGRKRFGPLAPSMAAAVIDFSPDGRLLAAGGYDGSVHFWDTSTGREIGEPLSHPEIVFSLTFSPDGKKLAAGTTRARIEFPHARVWDVATRRPLFDPFAGFDKEWVLFLEFTPDSRRLLVGTEFRTRVWDLETGKALVTQTPGLQRIFAQRLSPDGTLFATGDQNGVIRIAQTETGAPVGRPMQHTRPIQCLAFSPDGGMLVTGSTEGTVRLWDLKTFEPIGIPLAHRFPVFGVSFAPDGRTFLSADSEGHVRRWPIPVAVQGDPDDLASLLKGWTRRHLEDGVAGVLSKGDWRKAQSAAGDLARSGVQLGSETPEIGWHLGRAADAEDDRDWFGALWHLDRLVILEPNEWLHLARRGRAHAFREEWESASTDYDRAGQLALAQGNSGALLDWLRNGAYDARADRQWAVATWHLDRFLLGQPTDWQALADRSEAQGQLGRRSAQQADFGAALAASMDQSSLDDTAGRMAQGGKWSALCEEYARLAKTGWLFLEDWRRFAIAQLQAHDTEGYRQLCARLLDGVGEASVPAAVAQTIERICSLGPCSTTDLERARGVVRKSARPGTGVTARQPAPGPEKAADYWLQLEAKLRTQPAAAPSQPPTAP